MSTYKIIRFFQARDIKAKVIRTGLTLEQAEAHTADPETSSSTCKGAAGKARTKRYGAWFDGYAREDR